MPQLVEDNVIVRKSQPRVALIMNRVSDLVTSYPQFAVDSIIAKLAQWSASSVMGAASKTGVELRKGSRLERGDLNGTIANLFLDPDLSDEDLLQVRNLALGVVTSVTEPIYTADQEAEEVDPLA